MMCGASTDAWLLRWVRAEAALSGLPTRKAIRRRWSPSPCRTSPVPRLAPREIARRLFWLAPDRDESAARIFAEALLMLSATGFEPPRGELPSPKRRRFALRSLVIGV